VDATISRSSEAVFRRDDVQLLQTESRVIVMAQYNVALGGTRAVDALVVLKNVLGTKVDAAELFVVNFAIAAFEFKLQPARLNLTVAAVFVVRLVSQLSSLDVPLSGLVEVGRRLVDGRTGEARRRLFGGIPIASTSQARGGRRPSGVALGVFRLSSQFVASLDNATKPIHPCRGGLGGSVIRVGGRVCSGGVVVVMQLRVPVSHTKSLPTEAMRSYSKWSPRPSL